jgi:DNA mismatch repair ATPase MutS
VDKDNKTSRTIYEERIADNEKELRQLNKKHLSLGMVKLVLILLILLGLFQVFPVTIAVSLGLFGISALLFIIITFIHEGVLRRLKFLKTLILVNKQELDYLAHRFPDKSEWGSEFKEGDHNYTSDLDIFAKHGVFHYINRAVTAMGKRFLAKRLSEPLDYDAIKKQQDAVRELRDHLDLRQNVAAHGLHIGDTSRRLEDLHTFLKEPFVLLGRKILILFISIWPILTVTTAVLIAFKVSYLVFIGFMLVQVQINKRFHKVVSHIYDLTTTSHNVLKAYSRIMAEIEDQSFDSPLLKDLQHRLSGHMDSSHLKKASTCIRRLSSLSEWFDARNGMMHIIFNNIFFWDLHCLYQIEKWRQRVAHHVDPWLDVIAQFETLSSFATLHFNNPQWVVPEIVSGTFRLEAKEAGHLLISPHERICNDVTMKANQNSGGMMVVTGPNMAGKSTFLRTVGVNIVLALAGAPVCAKNFTVTPVTLFSSMQTSDSLDKHLSLFYAELQRLKMILDGIASGLPMFFLIDEMLKGTNALDRQKGAIALLKQLKKEKANGIVATHDLELTKLTSENYHFDGYVEDDKLLFDYLLKTGTCKSFNALALMKKMGINF